ncbi:protein kinase [Aquincola sp. MAHUQ-54]|uniref:Protein kinase n=1 Tax=Aquincola agrisoli TaxID=3119538 RepID=A0AAW9QDM8_9BURK
MAAVHGLSVTVGQHSRAGRGKAVNQDFHGAVLPPEPLRSRKGIAVALADGVGTSAVGHVASAAAVRGFLDDYYATAESWTVRRAAERVLAATNGWLHAQTMHGDARFDKDRGHVCTFSALVLKGRDAHLLHVGDARVCRLHPRALEPLTDDHRVPAPEGGHWLARALGAGPRVEIDYRRWPLEAGEVYLLATDGAHAHLDAAAVHAALARHGDDLDAAAEALTAAAHAACSDDDATVQLVRIDALPGAHAPSLADALPLPPPLAPRQRFEGFTIVRPLHTSARSHVHLAIDDASGTPVALKTPAVALRDDAAALDRFLLEDWVAQRVASPHLARPFDPGRPRTHLYVAMEYVEGQTLAQWMTDHPRPGLDEVRGLVEQIGRGVQALHGREMLHQDLRPENVMIDRHGTAKLIDFGAVHVAGLAEGSMQPRADTIEGTLQYAAPEYFTGDGGSERSDLFSMGVLAYQMLTGHLPYGLQVAQLRSRTDLRRLRWVPLRHHRPDLPPWLEAVLRRALQPEPSKRQEAVSELLHDLRAPGPRYRHERAVPLVERDPVRFWQAVSLGLGILLAGLSGWLVRMH